MVGKDAADLVTSDVEMALAFVLERKIYGVSVKNVLEHLPEKHPQSLDAMEKQFQKNVRQVSLQRNRSASIKLGLCFVNCALLPGERGLCLGWGPQINGG